MSEQSVSPEMGSPRQRAVAYLEMRQNQRVGGGEKKIKTPKVPDKVERTAPIVSTVTAYEKMIDSFGAKGYEGLKQKLEDMRPMAYDAAQAVQWGTRVADFALTAMMWVPDSMTILTAAKPGREKMAWKPMFKSHPDGLKVPYIRTLRKPTDAVTWFDKMGAVGEGYKSLRKDFWARSLTTVGMWRFRPLEWASGKAAEIGGAVLSSDMVAPVVNAILRGGERVQKTPDAAPAPAAT